jgi:hypothetical protein
MFACRSAHNNPQSFSETLGMMPNFAGVEKFFAYMTFKASGAAGHSCRKQFSTRQILNAKFPEPGGGSRCSLCWQWLFHNSYSQVFWLVFLPEAGQILQRKILKANHSGGRRCQDGPQRSEEYLDSTSRPTAVFMCV